ncbi:unnamed protein product [Clonostachys solani]|uniref:HNH nuclease domain-containing protein n=1 Tax=Clonostachys solani TaxID=160281 RepID=A0A9P0EMC0_9HYPO|nr:unnamed protein product [Clonostachys solani]
MPHMMDQVSEYLHRSQWEEPRDLLPVDELEQRLDLVERFQTWKRTQLAAEAEPDDDEAQKQAAEWKPNRLAYTACMTMPLSLLVEKRSGTQRPELKKPAKRRTGSHERTDVDSGADSGPEESAHSAQDPPYQESKGRSQKERKKALRYDEGRCRISGSPNPEVAHLIPFSFTNSASSTDRTMKFMRAFDLFGASLRIISLISGGAGLGETDDLINLICLDRNIHSNLDKGFLGIKYLGRVDIPGQDTAEITLQVMWMPMVKAAGFSHDDLIDLDNERDEASGFAYTIQSKADTAPGHKVFKAPGWPIVSGDKFTVRRPTSDAALFVEMVKLRWHLGQLAAISGAAGDSDFIFGHDDEFEEKVRNYGRVRRQVDREMAEEALEQKNKMAAQSPSKVKPQVPARRPEPPQPSMPGDLGDITNLPIRRRPGSPSKESSPTKTPTRSLTEARTRQQTAAGSDFSEQSVQVRGRSENTPSREDDEE